MRHFLVLGQEGSFLTEERHVTSNLHLSFELIELYYRRVCPSHHQWRGTCTGLRMQVQCRSFLVHVSCTILSQSPQSRNGPLLLDSRLCRSSPPLLPCTPCIFLLHPYPIRTAITYIRPTSTRAWSCRSLLWSVSVITECAAERGRSAWPPPLLATLFTSITSGSGILSLMFHITALRLRQTNTDSFLTYTYSNLRTFVLSGHAFLQPRLLFPTELAIQH